MPNYLVWRDHGKVQPIESDDGNENED
jgi:hypothetical protein